MVYLRVRPRVRPPPNPSSRRCGGSRSTCGVMGAPCNLASPRPGCVHRTRRFVSLSSLASTTRRLLLANGSASAPAARAPAAHAVPAASAPPAGLGSVGPTARRPRPSPAPYLRGCFANGCLGVDARTRIWFSVGLCVGVDAVGGTRTPSPLPLGIVEQRLQPEPHRHSPRTRTLRATLGGGMVAQFVGRVSLLWR